MSDKTLQCKDCGTTFIFTESEQAFFQEKGYTNDPTRCPECRSARKQARGNTRSFEQNNNQRSDRVLYPAVCANCGKQTMVPFKPSQDRPVYCRDCYQPRR